jgi:hypothetical protein
VRSTKWVGAHRKSFLDVDVETWHRVVHILEDACNVDLWHAHNLFQTLGANNYYHSSHFVLLCMSQCFSPFDSTIEFGFHYNTLLSILNLCFLFNIACYFISLSIQSRSRVSKKSVFCFFYLHVPHKAMVKGFGPQTN